VVKAEGLSCRFSARGMTVGEDTPHSIATRLRTAGLEDHNCGNIFDGEKEPRCAKRGSKFRGKAGHRGSYKNARPKTKKVSAAHHHRVGWAHASLGATDCAKNYAQVVYNQLPWNWENAAL
jgi:hypothetical protein